MTTISTYDRPALCTYFAGNFRKSRLSWLANSAEIIPPEGDISGIDIGKIGKVLRGFAKRPAVWEASRAWIRPDEPTWRAARLEQLQYAVGLSYLSKKEFVKAVQAQCQVWQRDHKDFKLWIDSRLALLERALYRESEDDVPAQDIKDQGSLLILSTLFAQKQNAAIDEAAKVGMAALSSAGQLVCDILGMKECSFTANLMIPVSKQVIQEKGSASEVWRDVSVNKYLMVVQETKPSGQSHVGFYVPIWRPKDKQLVPGAIEAYFNKAGSAVFLDDMPPLEDFDEVFRTQWRQSLATTLSENMFVSIPLVTRNERGVTQTPAVLNVNVDVNRDSNDDAYKSRRARHPEWLLLARDQVAKYVQVSLWTVTLVLGYTQQQNLIGDDLRLWDIYGKLPPPDRQQALPAPDEIDGEVLSIEGRGSGKGEDSPNKR